MMESSAPPQPPSEYLPGTEWRYRDVLFAFLAGLAGSFLVTAVMVAGGADPFDPLPFALIFAGQAIGSLAVIARLSRTRGTGSIARDTGFDLRLGDWWGVPAGMALQVAIALLTAPLIFWVFGDDPPQQEVSEVAGSSESPVEQIAIIVSVAVLAPILEEVIFRGMLLSALRRSLSAWPAIVVSAAVFAGIHLVDPSAIAVVPGLFILGIVLGWVALKRGDLSLAIALHSGINLLAAILLLWGDDILEWSEQQLEEMEAVVSLLPF